MATLTTAFHDEGNAAARKDIGPQTVYDRYDLAAALALNDVIRFRYIPKRVVCMDAWLHSDDLDTHATPTITLTLRLNDTSAQHNFFAASTVAQAGGVARADASGGAMGFETDDDDWFLEVLCAAAPATGATSGDIDVFLTYTGERIHADT